VTIKQPYYAKKKIIWKILSKILDVHIIYVIPAFKNVQHVEKLLGNVWIVLIIFMNFADIANNISA